MNENTLRIYESNSSVCLRKNSELELAKNLGDLVGIRYVL